MATPNYYAHNTICTITQLHNYAAPLGKGGEDPVLAHDGLVEDDLGAQVKLSPQADLQHGGVVDHGGVAVVLEHLGAGLGGEHVDGPASQAVGGVVDVELEASADVGLDVEALSLLVVHGDGGPVNACCCPSS